MLRADNVTFWYGRGPAGRRRDDLAASAGDARAARPPILRNVSAELRRGEILGLLGPNGAGKTTLLRVMSGTHRPTLGRVLLDGTPLDTLPRRAVARRIAVVPQETQLAFAYTVMELVLMGRHPHLGLFELEGPADVAAARDALAATGTAHLEERQFNTLSGGEKQRVVIASALAQASDVLLLDEPTASLDLRYQLEVASLLVALNRERGVSIAVSTHDLNFAARVCSHLVMLREGSVIADGPTADVLTPAHVRELYGVTADVRVHTATGHLTVVPLSRAAGGP